MFTGIIEEIGQIVSVQKGVRSSKLKIRGDIIFQDMNIGDSIAVEGVCLTVSRFEGDFFEADVMSETLARSTLGDFKMGSSVNLERAMAANGRFGGHIVSGHIDGRGTISEVRRDDNAIWFTISAEEEILDHIVEKGSICIDGISLTIAGLDRASFRVSIIPHTADVTTLGKKKKGDRVNLENDVIGKYVKKYLMKEPADAQSGITREYLRDAGF